MSNIAEDEYNEVLNITAAQWGELLRDKTIFKEQDIEFLTVLYQFPECKATASKIAAQLNMHYATLNGQQSRIVKRIMARLPEVEYPQQINGKIGYWHTLFLGGSAEKKGQYYWKFRPELKEAFEHYIQSRQSAAPQEINEHEAPQLWEGTKKTVQVNRYERNLEARRRCLEKYGYRCTVCNMNFEEVYGDIGKHFIEVHHLVPLHTIQQSYIVNPEQDLRPVCPNCHTMLHRANCSIAELQQIISQVQTKNNSKSQ